LIAGLIRLRAVQSLGWDEVPATIVDLGEQERIIAECDENLCGTKLTAAEQATFTAKRKAAYLALHPETAAGVSGGKARQGSANAKSAFADDQADKTGVSKRTVQANASRGEKITPAALGLVRGTALDTGAFLDRLKRAAWQGRA